MSPINWAGSDSEISPRHSFLCKNIDVLLRELAGPVTKISVFATGFVSNRDENFPI